MKTDLKYRVVTLATAGMVILAVLINAPRVITSALIGMCAVAIYKGIKFNLNALKEGLAEEKLEKEEFIELKEYLGNVEKEVFYFSIEDDEYDSIYSAIIANSKEHFFGRMTENGNIELIIRNEEGRILYRKELDFEVFLCLFTAKK